MADYDQSRPTERAKMMFDAAKTTSHMARVFSESEDQLMYRTMMADALGGLASGLCDLATGMRATYILLEKINNKLDRR